MKALKRLRSALLAAGASLMVCAVASAEPGAVTPAKWPSLPRQNLAGPTVAARVDRLLASMSLEEKVGQLIQADISSIKPAELRDYPIGSILAGGNSGPDGDDRAPASAWLALADDFYRVSVEKRAGHTPIPVLFGIDAVHGNNNLPGAVIFPHNVGLGAAHDPALLRRIAEVTADEVAIGGADWAFAPTLAVVRDVRWGRSYESYGEEPSLVRSYAASIVEGLQGKRGSKDFMGPHRTIATPKHFVGDGGTNEGRDQDDCKVDEQTLIDIHAAGYVPAIKAGALTVMASFSSWNGVKMVANKGLITDVLKGRLGFDGIVVSDWNAHSQVPGCTKYSCAAAINAGIDMLMAPDGWKRLFQNTLAQVRAGEIPMARIDDAVRRVLTVKILSGAFDRGLPSQRPAAGKFAALAGADHRAVAREAVRKSLVLLKNERNLLPLQAKSNVLIAGDGADNIAKQSGGWTISWQGTGSTNRDFPQGMSIYAGLQQAIESGGGRVELSADGSFQTKPDVAIVVIGEDPYAEFQGDLDTLEYVSSNENELAMLRKLKAQNIPVVTVFLSGRPLWTNPQLNLADAFVAAWLPGTEGGGIADLLVRAPDGAVRHDFTGKLSFSWPRTGLQDGKHRGDAGYDPLFPVGYGLSYKQGARVAALSEESGVPAAARINRNIYFRQGRAAGAWSLYTSDAQGAERVTATRQTSPRKIVDVRSVDVAQQEDAKHVTWNGAGEGSIRIEGRPVDLRRQSNGDMAVSLRFRVDATPTDRVKWTVNCGKDCGAATDVTDVLRAATPGAWTTLKVKLACFADAGADMQTVERPIELVTSGKLELTFTDIRLDSNTGDAICPGSGG
ncbi:glycoside hydrolase family 3 protein [Roseiterribacter gracilis]|uniref:1,4-beta-D-glucan glucohydrolase n=1 Tax=Roseiterribacter gracilis TaxID=2812848 RepID=A0A8S8XI73_9PROT|nr:1,4-beta-D-glucan glucohydrolase [Rhodospirillales bacterium TMPK1]